MLKTLHRVFETALNACRLFETGSPELKFILAKEAVDRDQGSQLRSPGRQNSMHPITHTSTGNPSRPGTFFFCMVFIA